MSRFCSDCKLVVIIMLIFSAIYLTPLASHQLLEPDEGRYAEIPREMIESGNYITPMLNYVKYFEKPPLLYWLNALSFKTFGQTPFAARFPSALSALMGIAVTGLFGARLFGRRAGAFAAVVTGTSLLYYAIGTINITDMLLTFFMTLTMIATYMGHINGDKRWYLLAYAAMALGTLTKGLIAIVLPAAIVFWYVVFTRKWKMIIDLLYLPGILLFSALAAPWFYLVCRDNPDFFHFFFIQEHFLRYTSKIHNRYEPFWFYLPLVPAAVMPWTAFLLALCSKKSALRSPDSPEAKNANIYLCTWFAVILLFFSVSGSKLIPYIAPCLPPLAILIGADINRMLQSNRWHGRVMGWSIAIGMLFSLAAFVYAFVGKDLTLKEDVLIAVGLSSGLLGGCLFAWYYTRRGNYERAFFSFCVGAVLFSFGLQSIYIPLDRTRSIWLVSREILAAQAPDETIAVYGEILQGVPFYTKQRVMLVGHMGELEFGAKQKEGEGWFPSGEEFMRWWRDGEPFVLVIENKRVAQLFPQGVTGAVRTITVDRYSIFFNKERS